MNAESEFPAEIWIGETTTPDLAGLCEALSEDNAIDETNDPCWTKRHLENSFLHFKGNSFETTEEFCIEHGIPFNRRQIGSRNVEHAYFRSGMSIPILTNTQPFIKFIVIYCIRVNT